MMPADLPASALVAVLLCGLGTYLMRLLPLLMRRRDPSDGNTTPAPRPSAWRTFAQAIGPAAVAALFVAMVAGNLKPVDARHLLPTLAGVAGTVLVHRLGRRSLALSTLGGALAYGLALVAAMG